MKWYSRQTARFLCASLASLAFAVSAHAATVYTSLTAFTNNTQPGLFTNTFTGTTGATTLPFSNGVFSYVISSSSTVFAGNGIVGADATTDDITLTFSSNNVTAIGGNFFYTDVSGAFAGNQPITVNLSDGTSVTPTPTSVNDYLGFTSTTPIASVVIAALNTEGYYVSLDNLSVGRASVVIPEGNTLPLLLMATPFLGITGGYRKKSVALSNQKNGIVR